MNFLNTIVNVVKKVLMIGAQELPAVVSAYNPPLGALLNTLFHAILVAQGQAPNAEASTKKDLAMAALQAALPSIEQLFVQNDKAIHDPALFASGIDKIHDGILDLLNSTGVKLPS